MTDEQRQAMAGLDAQGPARPFAISCPTRSLDEQWHRPYLNRHHQRRSQFFNTVGDGAGMGEHGIGPREDGAGQPACKGKGLVRQSIVTDQHSGRTASGRAGRFGAKHRA